MTGWQSVRRGEVGTIGLVVSNGVSDLLVVSRGGGTGRGGDGCMKLS